MGVKQKSAAAAYWSILEAVGRNGIQFAISIVLARLLVPEDFGAIAMLSLFIGLAMMVVDSGFASALIQRKDISDEETSSVFYFNLASAVLMAVALVLAAGAIADFYRMPVLRPLTYAMAANVVLSSLGSVHTTLLTRALDFKTQTRISLLAASISGAIGMVLAYSGYGVWSLALQTIGATLITTVLLWSWRPWRPRPVFRLAALGALYRFGIYLFLSGTLDVVYNRFNTLLIGKLFSAGDLGQFNRADQLQQMPVSIMSNMLNRVAFPVFSAANSDKDVLRRGVRKSNLLLMMVNLPLMVGMAIVAEPLVLVLYGEQWRPAIPLLRILCLAGILWPLHVINLSVLKAQGRSDLFFWLEIAKKVLAVGATVWAATVGLEAIAWSQVAIGVVSYVMNAHYTGTFLRYGAVRQILDLLPYGAATIAMAGAAYGAGLSYAFAGEVVQLAAATVAGGVIYGGLCVLFRLEAYRALLEILSARKRAK